MTPDNIGKSLQLYRPPSLGIREARELGETLAASGYFTDAKDVAQAAVKVLAGAELGVGPVAAMTGIHIIKNKVTIGANLIAAQIKRHPIYNYKVTEHTDDVCEIEFYEHGQLAGTSRFSLDDARRAGLTGNTSWRTYPRSMCFARALTNGARWYCPDVLGGPAPYVHEELDEDAEPSITVTDQRPDEQPAVAPDVPSDGEDARPLDQQEADRLLHVIRGLAPPPTLDEVLVALAAVGVNSPSDPEQAVRRLTVGQASQLLDELHKLQVATAENGATDLPWVEEYVAGDRSA